MNKQLTVLAFGPVTDVIGSNTMQIDFAPTSEELIHSLEKQFPALVGMSYTVAVNKQIVSGSVALEDGAIVALLPPFSGG
ncbi:MAG TPA: MoaD/ThiS family protein [Flavisolibacter sp.]|jgi:molybdopterin converting factor small subunit|nr:MoaD/ThiS family protein [Flavisolibacter sp.]